MPSWNIHLEAGNRIAKKLRFNKKEKQEFLFGRLDEKTAAEIAKKACKINAVQISVEDILDVDAILKRSDLNDDIKNDDYIFYSEESLNNLLEDMIESFTNDYLREDHA